MKNESMIRQKLEEEMGWLTFTRQDAVLEKLRSPARRPRKRRAALVLAFILALLCATAAALMLRFVPGYDAARSARDAVSAQYGLTAEMLDIFSEHAEQTPGGWRVTFTPVSLDMERIGSYEVTLPAGGAAQARWSHDGADLRDGSLAAPAWGPVQLEKVMAARRQNAQNWAGDVPANADALTLEDKAALDAGLLMEDGAASGLANIAPAAGDLTPEEAETRAFQALLDKYGIGGEGVTVQSVNFYYFDALAANEIFGKGEPQRVYRFDFLIPGLAGGFVVQLASPSGEALACDKLISPQQDFLPAGNLADYPEAVREWVDNGAFAYLSAEDKAETTRRFTEAGLRGLLPEEDFLSPVGARVTEAEAVTTAKQALGDRYQLTGARLAPFTRVTSLIRGAGGAAWKLVWNYDEQWRLEDHPHLPMERLGSYTIFVSAEEGGVVSCGWSLAGETQTDRLGTSRAWGAALIDRLIALSDGYAELIRPYREAEPDAAWNIGQFTVEDDAAACALMTAEGFPQRQSPYVLPQGTDLSLEQAVAQARLAVAEVYVPIDAEALPLLEEMTDCMLCYGEGQSPVRCWMVTFDDGMDRYTVQLGAADGVIWGVWHDSPCSGNG